MFAGNRRIPILAAGLLALASVAGTASAQSTSEGTSSSSSGQKGSAVSSDKSEAAATKHVDDAVAVVKRMRDDKNMAKLMADAKGVFIVPKYGRAAVGVGGAGGAGVLLVKRDNDKWSDPVFYNMGGISVGAQAGAEGGPIAMVLNNDKAVNKFMEKNSFSLSADAGLTVVNWSKMVQGTAGAGDVVVWTGTKGLFGDVATIGVNDIRFNQSLTNGYYHRTLSAKDVIDGAAKNAQADSLKQAVAAISSGATASGSSSTEGTSSSGKK